MPEPSQKSSEFPPKNPEKMDLNKLNFEELRELSQEVLKLAKTTFKKTDYGFKNVNGDGVAVDKRGELYRIFGLSEKLPEFHRFILARPNSILYKGSPDKEKIIQEIIEMINEVGWRIIE